MDASGPAAESGLTKAEQEDVLFQALLHRLPSVEDKAHLTELTHLALKLLLRRPADKALLDELAMQIDVILAHIPVGLPAQQEQVEVRLAVFRCVQVLNTAKRARLSRAAQAGHYESAAEGCAAPKKKRHRRRRSLWRIGWGWAMAALVVAGGVTMLSDGSDEPPPERPLTGLARQMEMAAMGETPAGNLFGGTLRVFQRDGRLVVQVEGVPPGACVSAGWQLVRRGVVSVNGQTPIRPSAAKLNEMCHEEEDFATIAWMPKPRN